MIEPYYQEEAGVIFNANCLDVMRTLPDKSVDLVLTDPPYGIGISNSVGGGSKRGKAKDFGENNWDEEIPQKKYFDEIFRISKNQIIFGGNYFIEYLSNSPAYIVWDKREGLPQRTFADCELAWTSFKSPARIFRFKWDGMIQENMKYKELRQHPTQKPLELMRWCLENYSKEGDLILDPFLGSGTTARACKDLGRKFIGVELEKKYCDIAVKRLDQQVLLLT